MTVETPDGRLALGRKDFVTDQPFASDFPQSLIFQIDRKLPFYHIVNPELIQHDVRESLDLNLLNGFYPAIPIDVFHIPAGKVGKLLRHHVQLDFSLTKPGTGL